MVIPPTGPKPLHQSHSQSSVQTLNPGDPLKRGSRMLQIKSLQNQKHIRLQAHLTNMVKAYLAQSFLDCLKQAAAYHQHNPPTATHPSPINLLHKLSSESQQQQYQQPQLVTLQTQESTPGGAYMLKSGLTFGSKEKKHLKAEMLIQQ